ncbi:MAG TPA: replication factor C large subunit [Candidatus Nanoarchaeia archaeon]|nr:replication factor C large subunit [Candidatus Nanoarchaeia archaeon]
MTKSFIEKYKPKNLEDIPQDTQMLLKLIKEKNNILIHGLTGTCKTSAVYKIADTLNYELLELNASDFRNRENVEKIVGENSKQTSLFNKKKMILVDEIEGLSGDQDRGGMQALARALEETKYPIIITTNNLNNEKIKEIKKAVKIIKFEPINSKQIEIILKKICDNENIEYDNIQIKKIAINSAGDIRAAINDLQSSIINNKIDAAEMTQRDYEITIENAMNTIFKSKSLHSYKITEYINADLDEIMLWLDENIPIEFDDLEDIENAYNKLGKADLFKSRIMRWQYWGFMHYQNIMLCSGVSLSRKNTKAKAVTYKRPMLPLKIWQSNMRNAKKMSIAKKLSNIVHTSTKKIIKNFEKYRLFLKEPQVLKEIELDEEEITFLNKK